MPVSRSHLTRPRPREVVVDFGEGDTLSITFDSNAITPAWMYRVEVIQNEMDSMLLSRQLADIILGWDLVEENGSEFPPTAENLAVLSYPMQTTLLGKIVEAAMPGSEEGNASMNISDTPTPASTSEPENLLNGQQPSGSQKPSDAPLLR